MFIHCPPAHGNSNRVIDSHDDRHAFTDCYAYVHADSRACTRAREVHAGHNH